MAVNKHNIQEGLQLESPNMLLTWGMSEETFLRKINAERLRKSRIATHYSLETEIFAERIKMMMYIEYLDGRLKSVYLSRPSEYFVGKDIETAGVESFKEIQSILIRAFGYPKISGYVDILFNYKNIRNFEWRFGNIKIEHKYGDSVRGASEDLRFTIN